jgi:hypothetical protein
MRVWRWSFLLLILFVSACARHHQVYCEPQIYTLQMVENKYGTPNEVISKPQYTWYGYVTKVSSDYPVLKNFSTLYPPKPIAIPVPVAHDRPETSFARYGCAVWFKADKRGLIIDIRRTGKYCAEKDFRQPVGH